MTSRITVGFIFALWCFVSCLSKQSNKQDFDKAVMVEIFPFLLDSMYVEITFSMTPPRIAEVVDSITGIQELNTVEKGTIDRELIRKDLNLCEQESNYITIVLSDSIHELSKDNLEVFQSKNPLSQELISSWAFQKSYPLPLNDLIVRNCFKLKLSSEYKPIIIDSLMGVRLFKEISFSRIVFDADKTRGMLTCEYVCGMLCGNGYRVYIKQVNRKWVIDYVDYAWIA